MFNILGLWCCIPIPSIPVAPTVAMTNRRTIAIVFVCIIFYLIFLIVVYYLYVGKIVVNYFTLLRITKSSPFRHSEGVRLYLSQPLQE
jgi:hypothetical protein